MSPLVSDVLRLLRKVTSSSNRLYGALDTLLKSKSNDANIHGLRQAYAQVYSLSLWVFQIDTKLDQIAAEIRNGKSCQLDGRNNSGQDQSSYRTLAERTTQGKRLVKRS